MTASRTLRSSWLPVLVGLAIGAGCLTSARAQAPPMPAAEPVETNDLANRASGCVLMTHPVGGIDAVQLRTLERVTVRQARVGRPAILAVSGPDEEGRIAFIEEDSSAGRYSLKTIKLDGSGEAEIFTRPGSALWDHAIDGLDMARAGYAKFDVATETLTPTHIPRNFHGDWAHGPLALIGDDVLLYRANPPRDVAPKLTENNSPFVGPKAMLSLKLAELSSGRFQTVVADLDPRTSVSFGGVDACH